MFQNKVGFNIKTYSYNFPLQVEQKLFNKPPSKKPSKYNFHNLAQFSCTGIAQRYTAAEGFCPEQVRQPPLIR